MDQTSAPKSRLSLADSAHIAEILSAIAVVVSLIYVGYELSQNTRAMETAAKIESQRIWYTLNDQQLASAGRFGLGAETYDPTKSLDDFERVDRLWLGLFVRTQLQRYQESYYRAEAGYLDETVWLRQSRNLATSIKTLPIWREVGEQDAPFVAPDFVTYVDGLEPSGSVNQVGASTLETEREQPGSSDA